MFKMLKRLVAEEKGQGMAEYGLILALVALAVITALGLMGGEISEIFDNIKTGLEGTEAE